MKQIWHVAITIVFLAFVFLILPVRRSVITTVSVVGYPFLYVQDRVYQRYRVVADAMQTRSQIYADYVWYRDMYMKMRSENVRLQARLAYAQAIEELAVFSRRYDTLRYGICAAIIFRQCTRDQQICIINSGHNRGVSEDMIVVHNNILVGRVEAVYPYMSRVRLITDSRLHVPVVCAQTQTRAIHRGMNTHDATQLLYVSHLSSVQPDEMVMTRSHGMIYPDGFGVGRVVSCEPSGLYQYVVVEPYCDIEAIDHCVVIQPGAEHEAAA